MTTIVKQVPNNVAIIGIDAILSFGEDFLNYCIDKRKIKQLIFSMAELMFYIQLRKELGRGSWVIINPYRK